MNPKAKLFQLISSPDWDFVNQGLELMEMLLDEDTELLQKLSAGMQFYKGRLQEYPTVLKKSKHRANIIPTIIAWLAELNDPLVQPLQEISIHQLSTIPEGLIKLPKLRLIDIRNSNISGSSLPIPGLRMNLSQQHLLFPKVQHLAIDDATVSLEFILQRYPHLKSIEAKRIWNIPLHKITDLDRITTQDLSITLLPQSGGKTLAERAVRLRVPFTTIKDHLHALPALTHLDLLSNPPNILELTKAIPQLQHLEVHSHLDVTIRKHITQFLNLQNIGTHFSQFLDTYHIRQMAAELSASLNAVLFQELAQQWKTGNLKVREINQIHISSDITEDSFSLEAIEWCTDFTLIKGKVQWTLRITTPMISFINELRGEALLKNIPAAQLCAHQWAGDIPHFDLPELQIYPAVRRLRQKHLMNTFIRKLRYTSGIPIQAPNDAEDVLLHPIVYRSVIDGVSKCQSLRTLKMEYCCQDSFDHQLLDNALQNTLNIEHLEIGNNQLQQIPMAIGNLQKLQRLFVYCNHLSTLPASMFQLKNLTVLSISFNSFSGIPSVVWKLPSLRKLYCRGITPTEHEQTQAAEKGISLHY